jgi:hypothetical protein
VKGVELLGCLCLLACATTEPASSESPAEPEFAGTWTGTASLATALGGNAVYPSVLMTVVGSPHGASVSNICPSFDRNEASASLSVNAAGAGAAVAWSGTLLCPSVPLAGCDRALVVYTNATLTRNRTNQLTLVATGTADGCGRTEQLVLTFVGTK